MPERIQLRRTKSWRLHDISPNAIVVARPSRWGNPFRIYHGHSLIGPTWSVASETWTHIPANQCIYGYVTSSGSIPISEAVEQYRLLLQIRRRDETERLDEWLSPLCGHDLACWCALDQPCHADVLLQLANQPARGADNNQEATRAEH